ncbi:hypothetical protein [Methanogenium cariaci]|uniref:hypothetical protein n=1 Tax=Methanogenium cariaci TaxID=2197 RepID=UPI000781D047|nr:hypothetical protein [Methanogenium cariaci]
MKTWGGVFFCLLLLLCVVVAPVAAGSPTTEVTVSKLAADGSLIATKTVDYHWMEKNLPFRVMELRITTTKGLRWVMKTG